MVDAEWREMFTPPKRFKPESLERDFLADYCRRFSGQRRAVAFLAAFSWISFLAWDFVHASFDAHLRDSLPLLIGLRVGGFIALVSVALLTLGECFEQNETEATVLLILGNVLWFAIIYMTMLMVPLANSFSEYSFGMFLCMVFAFGLLRLRAKLVLWMMLIYTFGSAFLVRLQITHQITQASAESEIASWALSSGMVVLGVIGTGLGIQLERAQRTAYLRERELAQCIRTITEHSRKIEELNLSLMRNNEVAEDRSRSLIELKEQMRQEAERRNQDKSQFLANAVHDLRQPLQAIGNALEPAYRFLQVDNKVQASSMIELAREATVRMRTLLADLLEISRLESGYTRAEIASIDLLSVANDVLLQLTDDAYEYGVTLSVDAQGLSRAVALSDKHFLTRILLNLVSNGIKYCDPDKPERWVTIRITALAESVRLDVVDNGIGIEPNELEAGHVFRPFYQAANVRSQSKKGVGLGLSIVSAMLRLLPDHLLQVRSHPGKGTSMRLDLPHGDEGCTSLRQEVPVFSSSHTLQGLYLLFVEDDELVRRSTVAVLEAHGALIESAASVQDLENTLKDMERAPDLVLSDLRLPQGQGPKEVLGAVENYFGKVPCIVMTGERLRTEDMAALNVETVLFKPVPVDDLVAAVTRVSRAWSLQVEGES